MLEPFKLIRRETVQEASAEIARLGERARPIAGGVELLLLLHQGQVDVDYLIDLTCIDILSSISWDGDAVHIGATASHHQLANSPVVRQHLPMLAHAESQVGNIRVRNQATLGGNLSFAAPHSDPATALLAYGATVVAQQRGTVRKIPIEEFFTGSYRTALGPHELLTKVLVPKAPMSSGQAFVRVEHYHRPPMANVAAIVDGSAGIVTSARLAVGCVGPVPVRVTELEEAICGQTLEDSIRYIEAEGKLYLAERVRPSSDWLGTSEYKLHVVVGLLRNVLTKAFRESE